VGLTQQTVADVFGGTGEGASQQSELQQSDLQRREDLILNELRNLLGLEEQPDPSASGSEDFRNPSSGSCSTDSTEQYHSTVQYFTVRYSTVKCSIFTVQYSIQYCTVQ